MRFCAVRGRSHRFFFIIWGTQGSLKCFTSHYIRQIVSRVIEHMVIDDHANMYWQHLKLNW